jgi:hypothetical protein
MATTLTTRVTSGTGATVKGSPLTNGEIDGNFLSLTNNKLEASSNLSDLTNATTARSNLSLGDIATQNKTSIDIDGGTIDGVTIGGNDSVTITGSLTGNVTGQVSDISNHDTDDLSETATNRYFTPTREEAVNAQAIAFAVAL